MADPISTNSSQSPNRPTTSSTLPHTEPAKSKSTSPAPAPSSITPDLGSSFEPAADRDLDVDAEINPSSASDPNAAMPASTEGPHLSQQPQSSTLNGIAVLPPIELRIAQKKDASLREFLGKMDDYAPLIPDAVTDYYLTLAGLPPPPETDRRLARLLALATQKFVADIAADAYQYSRIRSTNTTSNNPLTGLGGAAGFGVGGVEGDSGGKGKKDAGKGQSLGGPRAGYGGGGAGSGQGRTVLTMEDLGMAVGEYGVNVKRGEFYR